jgi:hypothetical protein
MGTKTDEPKKYHLFGRDMKKTFPILFRKVRKVRKVWFQRLRGGLERDFPGGGSYYIRPPTVKSQVSSLPPETFLKTKTGKSQSLWIARHSQTYPKLSSENKT